MIPSFPKFRDISIEDKKIFDTFLSKYRPLSSEYTFSNLFCWRNCGHSRITMINDNLCLLKEDIKGNVFFIEPIGSNRIIDTVKTCASYLKERGQKPKLIRLNEAFAEKFRDDHSYTIETERDNFDYIYLTSDLIDLKGKRFDGKRNRIRKFQREYRSKIKMIKSDDIPLCFELLMRWKEDKKIHDIDEPIKEALYNFEALQLNGLAVFVNNKIEAFAIGEKLNKETAVEYIEIASPKFAGLPQFINQKFCEMWANLKYINREQDLDDTGLRKAKLSYKPCKLIKKYNMSVKF